MVSDDIWTMSPFEQPYVKLENVPGDQLEAALFLLNSEERDFGDLQSELAARFRSGPSWPSLPNYLSSSTPAKDLRYDVLATEWDSWAVAGALAEVSEGEVGAPQPYGAPGLNCTSVWFSWLADADNTASC